MALKGSLSVSARQTVNPPCPGQRVHQRAGHEVIAPEDIVLRRIRQRTPEDGDQLQLNRIEMDVHQDSNFGRVLLTRTPKVP